MGDVDSGNAHAKTMSAAMPGPVHQGEAPLRSQAQNAKQPAISASAATANQTALMGGMSFREVAHSGSAAMRFVSDDRFNNSGRKRSTGKVN